MDFNDGLYAMYREVDELSLLNKLFATLICEKLNINNYLTNVNIQNKVYLKDSLEDINYNLDDSLTNIKNLIKIKKGYPVFKIDDIELISLIKTKISMEYMEEIVIENIKEEMNLILNLIKDIIYKVNNKESYETLSILSNISFQIKSKLLDFN